ncbi:unnamed protein product, partial [Mesorhabditis belari]|uniref:Uncharacterized protein n=1 Tax=Mesorhabditis belari TaxID=2138241 RepID=A0AAF3FGD6_9BILA
MSGDKFLETYHSIREWILITWEQWWKQMDELRIATPTLIALIFFLSSAVIVLTGFLMLLCCTRRPKRGKGDVQKEMLCKKGLFALMLARLDEFDSLTPLIVTPGTPLDAKEINISSSSLPPPRPSSTSPPPPRRPQGGRTLLVPLNTKYRAPAVPLLGTPESRVTTFEAGTTKSCATIPEDDEETYEDLVSIDRTSFSTRSDVKSQRYFSPSAYNLYVPNTPPEFQIPTPSYEPPPLPPVHNGFHQEKELQQLNKITIRPQKLIQKTPLKASRQEMRVEQQTILKEKSPTLGSSSSHSLSSPESSLGSDSPADTTGSLSDSFYVDPNYVKDADRRTDVDAGGKYALHRIEEESEHFSEDRLLHQQVPDAQIARSVSQQFELLQIRQQQQQSGEK